MKNIKKIIFAVIIMTALLVIAACSAPDDNKKENPGNNINVTQPESSAEAEPERFTPNLPDMDFNGYEFRALVPVNNIYGTYTFSVNEESGDIINDAIYRRNRYIEEKYNAALKEIIIDDFWKLNDTFRKSVMTGSDDFDVCLQIDRYAYDLAVEGYAISADKLPYLDITQSWYKQDINDTISISNKYFIAYSDECMSLYESYGVMCFNKKLAADLDVENLYSLVNGGAWTYDKFFALCRYATSDLDGDGKMTDTDRWGIVSADDWFLSNFWVCAGIRTVVKDSDGKVVLNISNEKFYNVMEKAHQNIFGGEKIYFSAGIDAAANLKPRSEQDGARDISFQQFENNTALFFSAFLGRVPRLRAMEADFGLIPFPKYDENQNRYYARVPGGWPKIVPNHIQDTERTSVLLEALAAESRNTVVPAFKEVSLRTKFTRDDESSEMVDIIFDTGFMDLGDIMWLDIRDTFMSEIRGNGNFASTAEKNSAKFQKILDKVNEAAANLE